MYRKPKNNKMTIPKKNYKCAYIDKIFGSSLSQRKKKGGSPVDMNIFFIYGHA